MGCRERRRGQNRTMKKTKLLWGAMSLKWGVNSHTPFILKAYIMLYMHGTHIYTYVHI